MNTPQRMPPNLAQIRDAAIAAAHGEGAPPRDLPKLFHWLFWESGDAEFDRPYFSLGDLNLSDDDLRDAIGASAGEPVTDGQRLNYVRQLIDRVWQSGEGLSFAHAFRIEGADGRSTYLCGASWAAGQAGPHTRCDGLYGSPRSYLQRLERDGFSNEVGSTISLAAALRYWQRDA